MISTNMKPEAEINKLCAKCEKSCRQAGTVTLIECKRYVPNPVQLAFKFKGDRAKKQKNALTDAVDENACD